MCKSLAPRDETMKPRSDIRPAPETGDAALDPLIERALEWLVHLHSGSETEQDWAEYQSWKAADAGQRQAAEQAERLWQGLGSALTRPATSRLKRAARLSLLILALGAAGFAGLRQLDRDQPGDLVGGFSRPAQRRALRAGTRSRLACAHPAGGRRIRAGPGAVPEEPCRTRRADQALWRKPGERQCQGDGRAAICPAGAAGRVRHLRGRDPYVGAAGGDQPRHPLRARAGFPGRDELRRRRPAFTFPDGERHATQGQT